MTMCARLVSSGGEREWGRCGGGGRGRGRGTTAVATHARGAHDVVVVEAFALNELLGDYIASAKEDLRVSRVNYAF